MKKYITYCTETQAKKARELGAPIEVKSIEKAPKDWQGKAYFTGTATCAKLPTTEEMTGWLEDTFDVRIGVIKVFTKYDFYIKYGDKLTVKHVSGYNSRREATLAAIDVALNYLSNNKK